MKDATQLGQWLIDANENGWSGLGEILEATIEANGEIGCGLCRCDHCDTPLLDAAVAGQMGLDENEGAAVMISDESGIGTTYLCEECYTAALEARKKIVVIAGTSPKDFDPEFDEWEPEQEDDSALTDEERELEAYLEKADRGQARQSRELIRDYPRDERRTLHRYQDDIDAAHRRHGKTVSE